MDKLSVQKLLSQNFFHDSRLVAKLVKDAAITSGDTVLEIGPGLGIITEELIKTAGKVIAVELDQNYFEMLQSRFSQYHNLELHHSNFLTFNLPCQSYKVFSNIPFRFTGDIIRKLLQAANPPETANLIVQKEAANKYLTPNLISVLFYPWFEFSFSRKFRREDFRPIPKVDIVLLQIKKRAIPLINSSNRKTYEDFVTYVFNQKKPHVIRLPKIPTQTSFHEWLDFFSKFLQEKSSSKLQHINGSATKLFLEQHKLQKIHRTRIDKNWKNYS